MIQEGDKALYTGEDRADLNGVQELRSMMKAEESLNLISASRSEVDGSESDVSKKAPSHLFGPLTPVLRVR